MLIYQNLNWFLLISVCFYIYDMGGDGYIGRDDMFHLLKNCIVKSITDEDQEEPVRELVEYCLKLLVSFIYLFVRQQYNIIILIVVKIYKTFYATFSSNVSIKSDTLHHERKINK